jgi:hypothetical protein
VTQERNNMDYPGLELKYSDGIAGARTMIALAGNAAALLCECQGLFQRYHEIFAF